MKIIPVPYKLDKKRGSAVFEDASCVIDSTLGDEEYTLVSQDGKVCISGGSEKALFYAQCTLDQVKSGERIQNCEIHDKPRFTYRSFMIDSARHFVEVDEIKKLVDAMAKLKFNIFHWHLTDDQGWRIESEHYPELNKAAVRAYSNFGKTRVEEPYGRVYTKDEIRDIVAYCKERFIDVVPEFDIPGHTSSLISAYPQVGCFNEKTEVKTRQGIYENTVCPAKEEAVEIVEGILDEMTELFPFGIYHIGGDEVKSEHWSKCPDCQKKMKELGITSFNDYENIFLNRICAYLKERGKRCIVWNDALKGSGLSDETIVQYWWEQDKNRTADFANGGGSVILSPFSYYYMDYDYDITSLRRTVSYNPTFKTLTEEGKTNILGVEAPVWTEFIDNPKRMEELLFPRIIAVACTAWQQEKFTYSKFLDASEDIIKKLRAQGYSFRDEKHWGYTRAMTPAGWARFVNTNYSADYILGRNKE